MPCFEITEFDSSDCIPPILNVRSKYPHDNVTEYYVWKKYGVIVARYMELNKSDSCFYEFTKESIIERRGESIVDSVILEVEISTYSKELLKNLKYNDGAFSFLLDFKYVDGSVAQIQRPKRYYHMLDSLSNSWGKDANGEMVFWVTVNEIGLLESVEVMNDLCVDDASDVIENELVKFKWTPAVYKGKAVNYRYKEAFFVH